MPKQPPPESADEDGKFSIGFRTTFNRSHSPTKLKVACLDGWRVVRLGPNELQAKQMQRLVELILSAQSGGNQPEFHLAPESGGGLPKACDR